MTAGRRIDQLAVESFAALMAAGAVDGPLIEAALGEDSAEFRRLGALALFGTGATLSDAERTRAGAHGARGSRLHGALRRAARLDPPRDHGQRLRTDCRGAGDQSLHVVLAAIDALGDRCITGDEAEPLTGRLIARAAHAAGHRLVAPRGARAGGCGQTRARARRDGDARVPHAQRVAGADVRGARGGAAERRLHAAEAGLRRQRQRARGRADAAAAAGRGRQRARLHRRARTERLSAGAHRRPRLEGARARTSTCSRRWSAPSSASPRRRRTRRATRGSRCSSGCARPAARRRRCSRSC